MDLVGRIINAADVSAGRLTALLGVFWATGGALVALSTAFGAYPDGFVPGLYGLGIAAMLLGTLLLLRRCVMLPTRLYVGLVVLGALVISLLVLWAGGDRVGVPAVLFVYVTCFAFVSFRSSAPLLVIVAAAGHLIVLLSLGTEGAFAVWLLTWGVAIVAGLVVGEVVEANRRALVEQDRLLAQLRQADETKTTLLNAVNHELARPMTSMLGLASTVAERGEALSAAERADLMQRVVNGTLQLRDTLDELLGLNELATGRVKLELEDLQVTDVVDRAIERSGLSPAAVTVSVPQDLKVRADRGWLGLAIANLLTNAARYGASDEPVTLDAVADGERLLIRVADRGPGIPDPVKEAVFEPFVRASDADISMGTGLGLSLVREFAHLHGGAAWVEDRAGGGARAVIAIPIRGRSGQPAGE